MSEHVRSTTDPTELRVALIVPEERAFYSPGVGYPQTFRGKAHFISDSGELRIGPSHETISERILQAPEFQFQPTTAVRALGVINGSYAYVRRPVGGSKGFMKREFTAYKYGFDEVVETAALVPSFIDATDLIILTEIFTRGVQDRRRTVIDLSR